jgi:hypothetical protein
MSISLELTAEDTSLLAEVLRLYLAELHEEISHTDSFDLREALQARHQRASQLLARLPAD